MLQLYKDADLFPYLPISFLFLCVWDVLHCQVSNQKLKLIVPLLKEHVSSVNMKRFDADLMELLCGTDEEICQAFNTYTNPVYSYVCVRPFMSVAVTVKQKSDNY